MRIEVHTAPPVELMREVAELRATVTRLTAEVAELRRAVELESHTVAGVAERQEKLYRGLERAGLRPPGRQRVARVA